MMVGIGRKVFAVTISLYRLSYFSIANYEMLMEINLVLRHSLRKPLRVYTPVFHAALRQQSLWVERVSCPLAKAGRTALPRGARV